MLVRLVTCLLGIATASAVLAQTCVEPPLPVPQPSTWVFAPSTYTHDPANGARVAQYDRIAPVEDLPDPRQVTSGYRRVRTNLRGSNGSLDSAYEVQSWGNGRGGIDAEWERFHSAWLQSTTAGGYYNQNSYGPYGGGYGYGGPGYGPVYGGNYYYPNGYPPQNGVPPYGPTPQHGPHFRQRYPDLE